jgi:D-glycero-alpha-D-manno-heptose 1-phosphate guanylyltransferase
MIECIILAGGLGTRLQQVVNDRPKCLAPVAGRPFLSYLLFYLKRQHVDHVVLSLGYKHEWVEEWLSHESFDFKITTVVEQQPLGTGGGIRLALQKTTEASVFVVNGDTFFPVSFSSMLQWHRQRNVKATIALKKMEHFDRYGTVSVDQDGIITAFHEKQFCESGWINGGVYLLQHHILDSFPEQFSFEQSFLSVEVAHRTLGGYVEDTYFIDIGIPDDYERANQELPHLIRSL